MAVRPRAARAWEHRKPMEVGGLTNWGEVDGSLANTASQRIATPPHSGEGCGDTLHRVEIDQKNMLLSLKERSSQVKESHHYFGSCSRAGICYFRNVPNGSPKKISVRA